MASMTSSLQPFDRQALKGWADLPRPLLESIATLAGPAATSACAAACKSWSQDLSDDVLWSRLHYRYVATHAAGPALRAWLEHLGSADCLQP